ncbi:MAG TPA: CoA transferase [Fimbriimonas sp.]|nr:CoA transferase [Fimbriimonas sp.]
MLDQIWTSLTGSSGRPASVRIEGSGRSPSVFAASDLAAASVAVAGLAWAKHVGADSVTVDRRLASFWFFVSIRSQGWNLPPAWDPIAGDYLAKDRWIRLHTNAPNHRKAAVEVLGSAGDKAELADAVRRWEADSLETAIIENGGCAAAMRGVGEWQTHPQGESVAAEPLFRIERMGTRSPRLLEGTRVLDLTRVLAGPVATRFLAGCGCDVIRIDPPSWNEPSLEPEVTLGKRCARLDLRVREDRETFERLLEEADVLVHGYRPEALDRLGYSGTNLHSLRPGLVEVTLDAYGWTGPWALRRGFDSLVQMSTGIAQAGMDRTCAERPTPLPFQALDQAAGYWMASAALHGLTQPTGSRTRVSLARVAEFLIAEGFREPSEPFAPETAADLSADVENTSWGAAKRLRSPVLVDGTPLEWPSPPVPLGSTPKDALAW